MPSVVASQLGVRGVVVAGGDGEGVGKVKEFEKSPRGGLGTFAWLKGEEGGWLRSRNELLRGFRGRDGVARVMVCEGGVCKEEGVLGGVRGLVGTDAGAGAGAGAVGGEEGEAGKEIDVSEVKAALPSLAEQSAGTQSATPTVGAETQKSEEKKAEASSIPTVPS